MRMRISLTFTMGILRAKVCRVTWTETALDSLRSGGHRHGSARRAVIELLGAEACCASAQEIHDRLRSGGASIGIASVYRALELLEAAGLVQRLDMAGDVAMYERVDPSQHHHHLVCTDCGRVEAFVDERLESALRKAESRVGFDIEAHEVVLRGACDDCRID
jgi:Fur family ferric uptake transcriptional regulator